MLLRSLAMSEQRDQEQESGTAHPKAGPIPCSRGAIICRQETLKTSLVHSAQTSGRLGLYGGGQRWWSLPGSPVILILSSGHPVRGGCVSLKLVQSALWSGRYFDPSSAELESAAQPGSAAKAVCSMERLFVPESKHGSGIGDCIDGGGVVLKRTRPDPAGEIESFRRPGRATLNSTGKE